MRFSSLASTRLVVERLWLLAFTLLLLNGINSCAARKINAPTTPGPTPSMTASPGSAPLAPGDGAAPVATTGAADRTVGILTSTAPVASLSVSPGIASLSAGGTQQLTATPKDATGNALSGRVLVWASSNTATATVRSTGLVTGIGTGRAVVSVTCEGQIAGSSIIVTVVPVASVAVTPGTASLNSGSTQQLTATPKDAAGNVIPGLSSTWASSNVAAASVNSTGLVKGVGLGLAVISATCQNQQGASTIVVSVVPVASVTVTPATSSVAVGSTQQLTATVKDVSGNALSGHTINWSSGNNATATVGASGLVRGMAAGSATVTATCEGRSGTSAITVSAPVPASGGLSNCPRFPADNIWNRDISALPVHANSAAWIGTMVQPGDQFHVNLGATIGQVINHTGPGYQVMTFGNCADAGVYRGLYPYTPGVTKLQGGDPDHHCIMLDTTACMLYEMYDASTSSNTCCYGIRWDLSSNQIQQYGMSSADEAGLPIATGLLTYHELFELRAINHALRFQCRDIDIDWHADSWLWPARHTSHPGIAYKSVLIPMGARIRLRANYQPTGAAASDPAFLALTAAMKKYGALLGDRGSSLIALSGAEGSRWGSWPNNFMNWSAQWIPYLEVVDESSLMIDRNSGQSR